MKLGHNIRALRNTKMATSPKISAFVRHANMFAADDLSFEHEEGEENDRCSSNLHLFKSAIPDDLIKSEVEQTLGEGGGEIPLI